MERSENSDSDSWGEELISEIIGKFSSVSGDMSIDSNSDHDQHLMISSKKPKITKKVSNNQVTARAVQGLYPNKYKNTNKFSTEERPENKEFLAQRMAKGYRTKIVVPQSADSIEKETKVEIKDNDVIESKDLSFVQPDEKPSMNPVNTMENDNL